MVANVNPRSDHKGGIRFKLVSYMITFYKKKDLFAAMIIIRFASRMEQEQQGTQTRPTGLCKAPEFPTCS